MLYKELSPFLEACQIAPGRNSSLIDFLSDAESSLPLYAMKLFLSDISLKYKKPISYSAINSALLSFEEKFSTLTRVLTHRQTISLYKKVKAGSVKKITVIADDDRHDLIDITIEEFFCFLVIKKHIREASELTKKGVSYSSGESETEDLLLSFVALSKKEREEDFIIRIIKTEIEHFLDLIYPELEKLGYFTKGKAEDKLSGIDTQKED